MTLLKKPALHEGLIKDALIICGEIMKKNLLVCPDNTVFENRPKLLCFGGFSNKREGPDQNIFRLQKVEFTLF